MNSKMKKPHHSATAEWRGNTRRRRRTARLVHGGVHTSWGAWADRRTDATHALKKHQTQPRRSRRTPHLLKKSIDHSARNRQRLVSLRQRIQHRQHIAEQRRRNIVPTHRTNIDHAATFCGSARDQSTSGRNSSHVTAPPVARSISSARSTGIGRDPSFHCVIVCGVMSKTRASLAALPR